MADEPNFDDLIALTKIGPDTTTDKYGGAINASFFDSANVVGTLSIKKLIEFDTPVGDQHPIRITDTGKKFMFEAEEKSKADFDHLDLAVLVQVRAGKNTSAAIAAAVNVRPTDLAMHLYRLLQQGYLTYEFRSGALKVMLTEKGFTQANSGTLPQPAKPEGVQQPQSAASAPPATALPPVQAATTPAPQAQPQPNAVQPQDQNAVQKKNKSKYILVLVCVIVLIVIMAAYMYESGRI